MSNTDERLSDLLAQRAQQGSGVHPTREGVTVALTRRAARRRRQRAVVTSLAGLCLVAGVVGGLALAGDDDNQEDGFTAPTGPLPEMPLVGLDIDGFVPGEPQMGDLHLDDEPARWVVVFRSDGSLADPFITVAVLPPVDGVRPDAPAAPEIDLDDDGVADASIGGSHLGVRLAWRLMDGSVAEVGAESEDALITYAREVFSPTLDLDDLPSPAGLPERDTWTVPDPRGPDEARVRYEAGDGSGRWITISTTNQPGWFDLLQDSSANPAEGYGYEEIALGPSFLGSGGAIVFDSYSGPGRDYALVRTDAGLTLEITTGCRSGQACTRPALDTGTIRDVIRTGAFVEVEPTDGPPTTTALAPATTAVTATTVVGELPLLPSARRTVDAAGDHIVLEFEDVQPALGPMTVIEDLTGACASWMTTFEDVITGNGDEDVTQWQGWLIIEMDTRAPVIEGPVFGGDGYIYCRDHSEASVIAVPLTNLGEPTVTPLAGRPAVLIDIPRP